MEQKRALQHIMAQRHPKDTSDALALPSEDSVDPRHSASQDMIDAFHERDPEKLTEALANFHQLHTEHMQAIEQDQSPPPPPID